MRYAAVILGPALGEIEVRLLPARNHLRIGSLLGDADGEGVCGDGLGSSWFPNTTRASAMLSEFTTDLLVLNSSSIRLLYRAADIPGEASAVHRLEYCVLSNATERFIEPLSESCFKPLARSVDPIDPTPILAADATIGLFLNPECSDVFAFGSNRPLITKWATPTDLPPGSHVMLRWTAHISTECCVDPVICQPDATKPDITAWTWTFPGFERACSLNYNSKPMPLCAQDQAVAEPQSFMPKRSSSGVKATVIRNCIDAYVPADGDDFHFRKQEAWSVQYTTLRRADYFAAVLRDLLDFPMCDSIDMTLLKFCRDLLAGKYPSTLRGMANYCFDGGTSEVQDCVLKYTALLQ